MTRLLIVRHAESDYNLQNRIQGHHDSGLTRRGQAQARALARRLSEYKIARVYSSDLGRATSTTAAVLKYLKAPLTLDPKLREIHLGDWEGMTPDEVDNLYDKGYQKWLKKPSSCVIPKSEPIAKFRRRITRRVAEIAAQNDGKTILVVTHGGAITALLAEWLSADFDSLLLRLRIDNTSLTYVDFKGKAPRLHAINDTRHLKEKDLHGGPVFDPQRS